MPHDRKRYEGLDLLRGLASLSVCVYHLTCFPFSTPDGVFYGALKSAVSYGWLGVEVFFVVSGFVIPLSLYRGGYRLSNYPRFILKTVVRLDPPYFAAVCVTLAVAYWVSAHTGSTWGRVLLHLGYLNAFAGRPWLNPVFWTLAIEFQYYLLIGLLYVPLSSRNGKVRVAGEAALGVACLALGTSGPSLASFGFLFLWGVLAFQYAVRITGLREYVALSGAAALGSFLTIGLPGTLAGFLAVLVIVSRGRGSKASVFAGRISYSLYLLHWCVGPVALSILSSKLIDTTADASKCLVLLLSVLTCVASAYVLYLAVERPAQRLSARMKYSPVKNSGEGMQDSGEPLTPPPTLPQSQDSAVAV
jgi:peptidoglycan/LPS O-acetylase OafA/YrhL